MRGALKVNDMLTSFPSQEVHRFSDEGPIEEKVDGEK